ncbi:hypothetical protein V9T40_011168 [Parthenolecanium corni]|uniref:Uncharacterized protein n=1 Tax=Parthenolecanium corni TaxID=536013 RepID=A0AAN9T4W7_9HEMI
MTLTYMCSKETKSGNIIINTSNLIISDGCEYHYSAFIASIWHRISPNQWFYVISGRDTLTVQYPHEKSASYTLPRSGIITLPSGTTGYTSSCVFHAGISNSTTIQGTITIPEVPIPNVTIPVIHSECALPVINRLDLGDICKSCEALAEAIADPHYSHNVSENFNNVQTESNSSFSFFSWLIGSISFSTWCPIGITIYLSYKYYSNIAQIATAPINFITEHLPAVLPEFVHSPALRRRTMIEPSTDSAVVPPRPIQCPHICISTDATTSG